MPRSPGEGYDDPMPSIISFRGWSRTGKTTLITNLIKELKGRGYRVCAMKSSHKNLSSQSDEGDSRRFTDAGALGVGLSHGGGMNFFLPAGEVTPALLERFFPDADFILAEGLKGPEVYRILTAGPAVRMDELKGSPDEWDLVITESSPLIEELDRAGIPHMSRSALSRLAELLERRQDRKESNPEIDRPGTPG